MLITLELKTMSASFQNLPTSPPQKYTKFSACQRTLKHCSRNFDDYTLSFVVAVAVAVV